MLKKTLACAFIILFALACTPRQNGKVYTFRSVGWQFTIPIADYVVEDSSSFYSRVKLDQQTAVIADSISKRLMTVVDSTGWFSSPYKMEVLLSNTWGNARPVEYYTDSIRKRFTFGYATSFGTERILDSTYAQVMVGSQSFNRSQYRVSRYGHEEMIYHYEAVINKYLMTVSISHIVDNRRGKRLDELWQESVFGK